MILAIVLFCFLGVSVLFNLGHLIESIVSIEGGSSSDAGPRLDEVLVENNGSRNKIAVLTIDGIISGQPIEARGLTMVDVIKAQLDLAADDDRVKAVILKVDSPGGEVLASDEIAGALRKFQNDSKKPVIVSMGSLAASGGYYVSVPCRWIVANELTITGSIGVIMESWNYRGLMDKVGLRPFTFKSGEHKDMLSGSRELSEIPEDEQKIIQSFIAQAYGRFTNVVSAGREYASEQNESEGKPLAANWNSYADGRVLSGKEAYDLGFVDELGNFDDAVNRAENIAAIGNADLIEYRQRHELGDLLRLFGETQSRAVKLDLGVEMPKIQAGHLYYLWPTYLR